MMNRLLKFPIMAGLFVFALASLFSCAERPPSRNEIPLIKEQISELVLFYKGEKDKGLDSLLEGTFHAEMGEQGKWRAIMVENQPWELSGTRNRQFFFAKGKGEAELSFVYTSPDGESDSLLQVKIKLTQKDDLWLVTDVIKVEPIGL